MGAAMERAEREAILRRVGLRLVRIERALGLATLPQDSLSFVIDPEHGGVRLDAREAEIVAVTAGVSASGEDVIGIEYADGAVVTQLGAWSEARELAERAGLDHMEPLAHGQTRWSRHTG